MKKIMVVDDEQEVLSVFKRFLEKTGYEPTVTDSWEEALSKFSKERFDLIILDVHMPGRDGFQIAKEMKDKKPYQKIVIITGLDPGEAYGYLSSVDVDVNEILYKPFSIKKVTQMITRVLES